MGFLKVYTENVKNDIYPEDLANSVHMSYSKDGKAFEALNQAYGILFARAYVDEKNTIHPRGIKNPSIRKEGNEYIISAEPLWTDEATRICWKTKDFVTFSEQETCASDFTGCIQNTLEIPTELEADLLARWKPLEAVKVAVLKEARVADFAELSDIRANVTYSDGSVDEKRIIWDIENKEKLDENRYRIKGRLQATETGFPLTVGYADPVVFYWKGSVYYLATNDNLDDIGIFVRKADSVELLFAENVWEECILDYSKEDGFCQTFWAPEFHIIGSELYILFAVSNEAWGPQCHMMKLKAGGDIMKAGDWEKPVRVCRRNGQPLTTDGITLDMTYFKNSQKSYLCWSYRYGIGTPLDTGSMLYIAETDENMPWKLISEPVLLSRPLYGWEYNTGTVNNEGPYPLIVNDKIFIAFSGGAACGYSYAVGYLEAQLQSNLLDVDNWKKYPSAMLHSLSVEGIEGPGHNSFFKDADGKIFIAYHAQETRQYHKRCSAIHRVHVGRLGIPMLNVVGERDVPSADRQVEIEITLATAVQ